MYNIIIRCSGFIPGTPESRNEPRWTLNKAKISYSSAHKSSYFLKFSLANGNSSFLMAHPEYLNITFILIFLSYPNSQCLSKYYLLESIKSLQNLPRKQSFENYLAHHIIYNYIKINQ